MSKPNPYSLSRSWSLATLDAFKSMPLYGGYVVALDWVKPKDLPAMERQWSEWMRKTDKALFPVWVHGWPERKAMRERQ